MKARLAVEAAVPEKVVINGSVGGGETQTRGKSVLELLADEFGVGLFGFHEEIRGMEWSAKRRQRRNTENTEAWAQKELTVATLRLRSGQAVVSEKKERREILRHRRPASAPRMKRKRACLAHDDNFRL